MFWKDYGKLVRRLWLNLFGAAVFGFMLSSCTTFLAEKSPDHAVLIYVISGVVGMFFYCYLLYLVIWEAGASDRIRVDGGRITPRPHKGALIALAFSAPALIAVFLYFAATLLIDNAGVENGVVNGVSNVSVLVAYLFDLPYVGYALALFGQLGKHIAEAGQRMPYAIYLFLMMLPAAAVIWGGYLLGYHGKLMSRVYKKKK
ncbi:MAG: hypothetical protein IKN38_06160 [Clostridia bacterium]|nr:hypothetical protein [Clostridia bacterium]